MVTMVNGNERQNILNYTKIFECNKESNMIYMVNHKIKFP